MAQTLISPRTIPTSLLAADRKAARRSTSAHTDELLKAQSQATWAEAERDALRVDQDAVRQAQSETTWAEAERDAIRTAAADREADLVEELAEMRQRVLDVEAERNLAILGLRGSLGAIETGLHFAELAA